MRKKTGLFFLLTAGLIAAACNSPFTQKPRGYFKIDFPKHEYRVFDMPGYPYTFEYPVYANIVKDSSFFGEQISNNWWINIEFPRFNGRIYVSYNAIGGKSLYKVPNGKGGYRDSLGLNTFEGLREGSYKLTYKHSLKASAIGEEPIQTANGIGGTFFDVSGNSATAKQFFLTDTSRHFLRGALYFDVSPNEDSLKIVNTFLQEDMRHLINTFKWR